MMSIRTRFAPSPTGYLHIGGVRTALFNWLLARSHGGQFLLRIDDTDSLRNVDEALEPILEGFRWLGLNWDEGPDVGGPYAPYFQSQRQHLYQAAIEQLLASGHAYRDYARTDELAEQRQAAEKAGQTFVYDRRWMAASDADAARFESEGRSAVVRLKMPREGKCVFEDVIRGRVEFEWSAEQDHVIQRPDGTCLYHLASVVDDDHFRITHVVRAVEHLSNTPRQIFIAQGLGYTLPVYAHLPYVAEPGGTAKMSKRKLAQYLKNPDFAALNALGHRIMQRTGRSVSAETFNPVIVDFYREIGFLPDAILNYLLLVGWSLDDSSEDFSREQMIDAFTLERVTKSPASFDPQKLLAFQARWMQRLDMKKKVAMCLPYLQRAGLVTDPAPCSISDYLSALLTAAGDRIKVAGDILDFDDFFVSDEKLAYDPAALDKRLRKDPRGVELLRGFRQKLAELVEFSAASTEAALKQYIEAEQAKIGQIIHALRVAVTGKAVGFGMFETLAILGQKRVLNRIDRALAL